MNLSPTILVVTVFLFQSAFTQKTSENDATATESARTNMNLPAEDEDEKPKELKPAGNSKENPSPTTGTKLFDNADNVPVLMPTFKCEMLEECDINDANSQIIGILESKVVKMEKMLNEIIQKLNDVESKSKEKIGNVEKMIEEKCSCNADSRNGKPGDKNDLRQRPTSPMTTAPSRMTTGTDDETSANPDPNSTPSLSQAQFYALKTRGNNPRCLDALNGPNNNGAILAKRCNNETASQHWEMVDGSFQNKEYNKLCLDGSGDVGVALVRCDAGSKYQKWQTLPDNTIKNVGSSFCLTTGAYWAITAECDGKFWQQYDYLEQLKLRQNYIPGIYFVTYYP